jgi:hypothetical protein
MLTMPAKQLAVATGNPDFGGGQVQISHRALAPAMRTGSFLAEKMTQGLKAFVGFYLNASFADIG